MRELHVRAGAGDGQWRDLTLRYDDRHHVGDVADAIANHLGTVVDRPALRIAGWRSSVAGSPTVVDRAIRMVEAPVVSGDDLTLATSNVSQDPATASGQPSQPRSVVVADVVGGPSTGQSLVLNPGCWRVGRDRSNDVVLADPTVSPQHAWIEVTAEGSVTVRPAAAIVNPIVVDGEPKTRPTALGLASVVQVGASALTVRTVMMAASTARVAQGQRWFNRTPQRPVTVEAVTIPRPPQPPQRQQPQPVALATMLVPALAAGVAASMFQRPEFLVFALVGPVTAIVNRASERSRGGRTFRREQEKFTRGVKGWLRRFDAALVDERMQRHAATPDVADLIRRAQHCAGDLWPTTGSSMQVRVGLGSSRASTQVAADGPDDQPVDDDTDSLRIADAVRRRQHLHGVPIGVDLVRDPVVAIHGNRSDARALVSSLVIQAATLHAPDDLVIAAAGVPGCPVTDALKWLPHSRIASSPIAGAHVVSGDADATTLLAQIDAATRRRAASEPPRVLLVIDETVSIDGTVLPMMMASAGNRGLSVLWWGGDRNRTPRQATAVVEVCTPAAGRPSQVWFTDPKRDPTDVDLNLVPLAVTERGCRALASVRDGSATSAANALPTTVSLSEVMGMTTFHASEIRRRWATAPVDSLRAVVGVGAQGPVVVDLVEQGPHALIAGTSGSGKSEFLQTLVAGLVSSSSPSRLNVLFIDYKGGATSAAFAPVPHVVGSVTNLKADTARRALVCLRAELDRRMRILEGRAKDLSQMLAVAPDEAPARLVIVIDEFATLVAALPEFVDGIVDIAQRGRSLGIHLVLATQRPSGAVNDHILANVNLRICLRVLDRTDAVGVMGSPEAATIAAALRGRAFLRYGSASPVEVQTAYGGMPQRPSATNPVEVRSFTLDAPTQPAPSFEEQGRSELDAIIAAVVAAGRQPHASPPHRPWLDHLPSPLALDTVLDGVDAQLTGRSGGCAVVLGMLDEPQWQRQRPFIVDLRETGGLLIFGGAGSGRSTALRTAIGSVLSAADGGPVELYLCDLAGRSLVNGDALAQAAVAVAGDDREVVTRILQHLHAEVTRRQRGGEGDRGGAATLLLVVDGLEVLLRMFDHGVGSRWVDLLTGLVQAGRAVGVHLIASVDRRSSLPPGLFAAVEARVVLRMADPDLAIDLGVRPTIARSADLGDGRGLTTDGTVLQIATVGGCVETGQQQQALAALACASASPAAPRLPSLPDWLPRQELPAGPVGPTCAVIGVADLTLEPVVCDVRRQHLLVTGPPASGRSTALTTVASELFRAGCQTWVVAEPASPLEHVDAARVATRRADVAALLEDLAREPAATAPRILVIDRAEMIDERAAVALDQALRDDQLRLVAGADLATVTGYAGGWLAHLRSTRLRLLLQPDDGVAVDMAGRDLLLRPEQPFPPGRGVLLDGRRARLVQVSTGLSDVPQCSTGRSP